MGSPAQNESDRTRTGPRTSRGERGGPRWIPAIMVGSVVVMLLFVAALVESPTSPPPPPCGLDCGILFSWGTPFNDTGPPPPVGCPSAITGHYCYSIEIAGDGGALPTSAMNFWLRSSVGVRIPWPAGSNPDVIWLVAPYDGYPVVAQFDTITSSWTLYGNFTGTVSGGFTIVVFTGGTGSVYGLQGDQLVFEGTDGYSATVPSNSFP